MKKDKIVKLALLGLANGLLLNAVISAGEPTSPEGSQSAAIKHQNLYASADKCKGPGGCPGASHASKPIALRDAPGQSKLQNPSGESHSYDANSENLGYHLMTEDELMLELNDDGVKLYNSLTPEGKALARDVASQRCNGTNQCAGLNACETKTNSCAGKGKCKGTSKCAFADKNLAVKVVADKMAKKRAEAMPNH